MSCGYEPQQPEGTQYEVGAEINRTIVATATFTVSGSSRSCFTETGFCAQGRFLAYWRAHGGLAVNGYPISDEFDQLLEDGRTYRVQYFERARLELHPENVPPYDVLLGQFGRRILAVQGQRASARDSTSECYDVADLQQVLARGSVSASCVGVSLLWGSRQGHSHW